MARAALRIQDKINKGWAKEARKLGQRWNVERNDVVVVQNYDGIVQHSEEMALVEGDAISFTYKLRGSRAKLLTGDYLVGLESQSKRGMANALERYLLVTTRLHRDSMLARTDRSVAVFRMQSTMQAGAVASQYEMLSTLNAPRLARNVSTGIWEFVNTANFTLAPGAFAGFGSGINTGYSFNIWAGITFGRSGEYTPNLDVPLGTPNLGWVITCPLFSGIELRPDDIVQDDIGNYYRVDRPYRQTDSMYCYQLRCTLMRT